MAFLRWLIYIGSTGEEKFSDNCFSLTSLNTCYKNS